METQHNYNFTKREVENIKFAIETQINLTDDTMDFTSILNKLNLED